MSIICTQAENCATMSSQEPVLSKYLRYERLKGTHPQIMIGVFSPDTYRTHRHDNQPDEQYLNSLVNRARAELRESVERIYGWLMSGHKQKKVWSMAP